MKKVLVTGGAGFLGSHLVDALLERGLAVSALDNLFRGRKANLSEALKNPKFSFIEGDICDLETVKEAVRGCDTIFHLAAINGTRYFYEMPDTVMRVNIAGTENILDAATGEEIPRVVFTSTSEIYGRTGVIPTPEESESVFMPPDSVRWSYALSKLLDEHLCLAFTRRVGLWTRILRIFNAYGPRQVSSDYGQVVGMFARRLVNGQSPVIYGDGEQTRSFTYVGDIVEGIIQSAGAGGEPGRIFNLGSQQEITVNKLADTMIGVAGMEGQVKPEYADAIPDEPPRRCPSIEKARKAFDYKPQVSLRDGLKKTIDWFKESTA